ncbi:ABC transporter [Stenotrophomonas koreensis]|uniref:ABC transporter n=1 Tax=Stenotrophomonas koreensis TaxID=266128 RepID=A0A0R0BSS3_9GAMM|nr:ABC-type transport auxiliary lipoprotein family protein [Stenotrophomonas koreensis]KRG56673.1 ABC transporter [Stenotrophomonas koreensis]
MKIQQTLSALCLPILLAGCALLGGGKPRHITVYTPLTTQLDSSSAQWPQVDWQLGIAKPAAERMLDSPRIAVRPQAQQLQVYRGATWSMPATDLLETSVLRVLEDSGKAPGVARLSSGLRADYRLLLDIRRFEADYAGHATPQATIVVNAKLLHSASQRLVGSHTFSQAVPAAGTAIEQVVPAFEQALGRISQQIAGWSLQQGQQHAGSLPDSTHQQ